MAKPRGLGKGLDLMIPNVVGEEKGKKVQETKTTEVTKENEQGETIVKITKVEPNREQPRKYFDEDALQELADSIKQFGLLQPILVQDRKDYYEIIAGERRWRAAKLAGLKEVPCLSLQIDSQQSSLLALVENLQRRDLDFWEEALALERLIHTFHLSQEECAKRIGKSQSAVANKLRLLKLPEDVLELLRGGGCTERHARALLRLDSPALQLQCATEVVDGQLTVSQTEGLVAALLRAGTRVVTFRWADMAFTGQLIEVAADYTMFSVSGKPIRSKVRMNIAQQVESDADFLSWDRALDKVFGDEESVALKGAAQNLGNLLNLDAF